MAVEKISIERFLSLSATTPVIDVRSPAEYKHAHIPGASSLPLFTDEERKIVGTTYKQVSREQAIKKGLEYFGPKMLSIVEEACKISDFRLQIADSTQPQIVHGTQWANRQSKTLLIYCWRGGMRSAAIAWLLDLYGFKVYTLAGGYKKFRNHVLDVFRQPFSLKILGGFTGSGKTELLKSLAEQGETIIDLEGIASHKGSAFGNIGMPEQPGQEMFENILAISLISVMKKEEVNYSIWLEDESQRIGLVNIPGDLWSTMRQSPVYFIDIPFEERLDHLVEEYKSCNPQRIIDAIGRIREKLGGLNAKNAIESIESGDLKACFRILLNYYDKFYLKALHNRKGLDSLLHTINCESVTPENAQLLVPQFKYQAQST